MPTQTIATALMFGIAQIIEGEATCVGCDRPAKLTVWTGADPEPEPYCLEHSLIMLDVTRRCATDIFGGNG
jgi:hypothetical protein